MQHLRQIYETNIPNPIKMKHTHWASDPFTRGSYSYLPINVNKSRVTLLGEATSTTDPSTVHGAYLSGILAAKEVLARIKKE